MVIEKIVKRVNEYLAGELLSFEQLKPYLDAVIDDINTQLNSIYPAFSEINPIAVTDDYNFFPDRYIRNVLCLGAAYKYYTTDEEGVGNASTYRDEYHANLFFMIRDWLASVPEEYQNVDTNGAHAVEIQGIEDTEEGIFGIDFSIVRT